MNIEQTPTQPDRDRFDCLCDCVLIDCTAGDASAFDMRGEAYAQAFKRRAVNAGTRRVIADAGCQLCQGTGFAHDPQAARDCA